MTQLSAHFRLSEFTRSATAEAQKLDNTPSAAVIERLTLLCVELLEPLRLLVGPIKILSGYRGPALNAAVGGARASQHMTGEAADIEVPGMANAELSRLIQESGLEFDQLIEEFLIVGDAEAGWIHLSRRAGANRKQVLAIGSTRKTS